VRCKYKELYIVDDAIRRQLRDCLISICTDKECWNLPLHMFMCNLMDEEEKRKFLTLVTIVESEFCFRSAATPGKIMEIFSV